MLVFVPRTRLAVPFGRPRSEEGGCEGLSRPAIYWDSEWDCGGAVPLGTSCRVLSYGVQAPCPEVRLPRGGLARGPGTLSPMWRELELHTCHLCCRWSPRAVWLTKFSTKSQTQLSNFTSTFHFHALEKEMATHSSTLAWRIPWREEPGRLQSMGLRRVGHD